MRRWRTGLQGNKILYTTIHLIGGSIRRSADVWEGDPGVVSIFMLTGHGTEKATD